MSGAQTKNPWQGQCSTTIHSVSGRQSVRVAGYPQRGHVLEDARRLDWRSRSRAACRRTVWSNSCAAWSWAALARSTCSKARSWSCRLRHRRWKNSPSFDWTNPPDRTGFEQIEQVGSGDVRGIWTPRLRPGSYSTGWIRRALRHATAEPESMVPLSREDDNASVAFLPWVWRPELGTR